MMSRHTTRFSILASFLVAALGLSGLAGCGGDKSTNPGGGGGGGGGGSTTYTGTVTAVTGTGVNGTLTITVATSSPAPQTGTYGRGATVNATGTFTPAGGSAISLTGIYDSGTHTVGLTNSGGTWVFGGTVSSGKMDGDATGPSGAFGHFTLIQGSSTVTTIIGRYQSVTPPGSNGDFNISISGAVVHGAAHSDDGGDPIPLDGSYNSSNGAISIVNPANPGGPPAATGSYNSGTGAASGDYNTGAEVGTWSGNKVTTQPF